LVKARVNTKAHELYETHKKTAVAEARTDRLHRVRHALWTNCLNLNDLWVSHNKETVKKKQRSIKRSIDNLVEMMEEQVCVHNALLSILDRADEKSVAKDCTSGTFEPPKEWEDTGTSEAGSDMREEFVDTYDRLLRCNEQGIINIHQIRSFDFLLGVLLDRLKKSLEAHLDASETPGELAKALYTMRELKLMRGLREQFDKAKFRLPPLPAVAEHDGAGEDDDDGNGDGDGYVEGGGAGQRADAAEGAGAGAGEGAGEVEAKGEGAGEGEGEGPSDTASEAESTANATSNTASDAESDGSLTSGTDTDSDEPDD